MLKQGLGHHDFLSTPSFLCQQHLQILSHHQFQGLSPFCFHTC